MLSEEFGQRKPDLIDRMVNQANDNAATTIRKSRFPSRTEVSSEIVNPVCFKKSRASEEDSYAWNPGYPTREPASLLSSHPVPDEYMVTKVIGAKLPLIKLANCHTDLLLFLFYAWQEDITQLVAASLLFERGWRFHTVEKIWIARWPGVTPENKTTEWEEGLYQYFEVKTWRRVPGWFRLVYSQLAEKTEILEKDLVL